MPFPSAERAEFRHFHQTFLLYAFSESLVKREVIRHFRHWKPELERSFQGHSQFCVSNSRRPEPDYQFEISRISDRIPAKPERHVEKYVVMRDSGCTRPAF